MPYKDKEDQRRASARHYQVNRPRYQAKAKTSREAIKDAIRELKKEACADCGAKYHYSVMQFDHTGTDKVASIASLTKTSNLTKILEEVAKCELVCANCHAFRTWKRYQ